MLIEPNELLWLDDEYTFSLAQLSELSGVTEAQLTEMVDEGILSPIDPESGQWVFAADRLVTVRMAVRLRRDFELDPEGLALVVTLLERVRSLEAEVRELRAKLPRFLR